MLNSNSVARVETVGRPLKVLRSSLVCNQEAPSQMKEKPQNGIPRKTPLQCSCQVQENVDFCKAVSILQLHMIIVQKRNKLKKQKLRSTQFLCPAPKQDENRNLLLDQGYFEERMQSVDFEKPKNQDLGGFLK